MKLWKLISATAVLLVILAGLTLTALKKETYVIQDGATVFRHISFSQSPADALAETVGALGPEDTYLVQAAEDATYITVVRLQAVTLWHGDNCTTVRTSGENVGELLARLGLALTDSQRLNYDTDAATFDGMELQIIDITYQEEVQQYTLPAQELRLESAGLEPGEEAVLAAGADGLVKESVRITYENGIEASRQTILHSVVQPQEPRIVLYGADRNASALTFPLESETGGSTAAISGGGTITTAGGEVIAYTKALSCTATAYSCEGYTGTTAIGTTARVGAIAVDPSVIPYGTRMYIVSDDGEYIYGYATAEDCGNFTGYHIDLYFDTEDECWSFGRRSCTVYILEN